MKDTFTAPATITKITTMADKTIRLQVDTQEITDPNQLASLFVFNMAYGHFAFAHTPSEAINSIPDAPPTPPAETKSPSQRLRNILYVLYSKTHSPSGDIKFEDFYKSKMEKIIDHFQSMIPQEEEQDVE